MQLRYITAIVVIALIFLPMSGSPGMPEGVSVETAVEISAISAALSASTGIVSAIPRDQREMPAALPEEQPAPAQSDQPGTPAAQSTPTIPHESPSAQEDSNLPAFPDREMSDPLVSSEETSPPGSPDGDPQAPAVEDSPDDPVVIADSFPSTDLDIREYTVFRNEVLAIIGEAERLSGIKTVYGVFVMDLVNNYTCGVNEKLTRVDPYDNMKEGYFNSASVIKLFQGYILCDMMRRGELSADEVYYDAVTGRKFRLLKMIRNMISYSDNNYSNAALRLIENQKSNEVLDRLGIHDSRIYGEMSGAIGYSRENNLKKYGTIKRCARITPRDAGLILYNIYVNRETDIYMETLNEALKGNIYNTRIPVGVARVNPDYEVAHKTGTNSQLGVYNDAGIVYCRRPFILVAFTQSATSTAGEGFIRILAEKLTRYFDSRAQTTNQEAGFQSISSGSRPG